MNIRPDIPDPQRRLWTTTELRQLEAAGILRPEERVELIAGEIVRMSPKGARHEVLRNELVLYWSDRRPKDVKFAEEPPLTLDDHYEPEPDIILFPAALRVDQVRGENVLLVVEIADSSLSWDLGAKSRTYAAFGVREYWVIDAGTRATTVHRGPSPDGYGAVVRQESQDLLTPMLIPTLPVRIADLSLD